MVRYSRYRQEKIRINNVFSSSSALFPIIPVITDVTMTLASDNQALSGNPPGGYHGNGTINFINSSKIMKMIRIIGLMAVISYMIVILFTWVYANLKGYEYFSAGEPELIIKYSEWALGAIGIFSAFDCLRKELKDEITYKDEKTLISTDLSSCQ